MASSPFRRAVEALERAHRLALILLVGPNDRAQEARELLDKLLPPHVRARSYRIDRQGPDLLSFAESLGDRFPILFVHGFERIPPAQRGDVEIRLNLLRDAFAQHHLGLIFWLPRDTLESFLQHCPDLFAWRSLLAEVKGSELIVSPIVSTSREYLSRVLRQAAPLLGGRPRPPEDLVEVRVRVAGQSSLPIGFQEWAVKTRLGIVVGEAGSGKTTALQALAHRLADHAYDDATQPVPVLLHGGAFSPSSRFDTNETWPREANLELPSDVLSALAKGGQLIILFDALDETPPVTRNALLDWIDRLSHTYPLLKVIIATRFLGQGSGLRARLSQNWEIVQIQGLTLEQIYELIDQYLNLRDITLPEADRVEIGTAIVNSPILQYPLFVLMWLSNYLKYGHVPLGGQRRFVHLSWFLSNFIDYQLRDFDEMTSRYRGVGLAQRADLISFRELRRALQSTALAAMTAGTSRISRDMLLSNFEEVPDLFSSEVVRKNAEYLLISRSGLLQQEAESFSFVHMSIQQYLAAEALVELVPDQALELLKRHFADPRWSEVVAYTVALLETRYSTGRKLLDTLAGHALRIPEAEPRAASFATLLDTALGVDVWSETLASVLQAARLMTEDSSDARYALEPVVVGAMQRHNKVG